MKPVIIDSESGYTTQDFRDAISGEGPLAYTWVDKSHRLVFDLLKFIEANAENVKPLNGEIVHLTGAEMSAIMGKITISVEPNSQEMRDKISGTKEAYENFIRAGLHDECSCDECCEVF